MQAIVKLALEPEWETRFEANSYGFRPGRCTMDAIEAIFIALGQKGSSRWIFDADISGCFDAIAHRSCWDPGCWPAYLTRAATRAPRRALPRRRALCTNSKKPR